MRLRCHSGAYEVGARGWRAYTNDWHSEGQFTVHGRGSRRRPRGGGGGLSHVVERGRRRYSSGLVLCRLSYAH